MRLASRTRRFDGEGDLLDALGPGGFAWLKGGAGFVTSGVAARIAVPSGAGRLAAAAADVAAVLGAVDSNDPLGGPATGPLAVGALPFGDGSAGELAVPAVVVGRDAAGNGWITETGPAPALPSRPPERPTTVQAPRLWVKEHPGRAEWTAAVRRLLVGIDAGTLVKVVLARELVVEADEPFDRHRVLAALRATHPSCFTYAAGSFVGASPELLVSRSGGVVTARPMAGTVVRGETAADDDRLVEDLSSSPKEAAEHRLLVDAVVEALRPVCVGRPVASPAEVVRLATVSHLATEVRGMVADPGASALTLAGRLHPTPAVGGLPRGAALAALAELEPFDRGLYAGPVGWVGAAGDGEWAVALRGAELDGARARLAAGAGIVAGSDPDAEWDETEAKLATMLAALGVG